jgi:dinuclear metal center YbgI/SA1388 family protein
MSLTLADVILELERIAPCELQESYDNAGLITGQYDAPLTGVMCTLDCTEAVVMEAVQKGCNLVVAHHPIVFRGLKRLNGNNHVERAVIAAIKNDIAIYAIHTNLDNVLHRGVNERIAQQIGLRADSLRILAPMRERLMKLTTFVPIDQAERVREAIFTAGAGRIGQYDECSFNTEGLGTFRAGQGTNPFVGKHGERHTEAEQRIEVILPRHLENAVMNALREAHPYEEIAYDLIPLLNQWQEAGSGLLGELPEPMPVADFLKHVKTSMQVSQLRFAEGDGRLINKVAVCGGAGSFLIGKALRQADAYLTSDIKYHEFFEAENSLLLCDLGHFESEKFTISLISEIIRGKFPNFAVLLSETETNPVKYYS